MDLHQIISFHQTFSIQGLAEYVLVHVREARNRGLVVGHDHRHHSEHWARLTAQIFIANGFRVYLLQGNVHTPL
jgi:phosphoglucomutase